VEVLIPAETLSSGDYLLTLEADGQRAALFFFRVTKR
jgi:hypothetical protein